MTIPAALSIAAATIGFVAALLSWRLSKAPGWQEMRCFALVALTAGIYCLCEASTTIGASDQTVVWASRLGMLGAAFHGPAWLLYIAAGERRRTRRWERAVVATGVLAGIVSAVPGGIVTDRVTHREVAWVGATYADVEATSFGTMIYGLYCATLLIPLAIFVRDAVRRKPAAAAHAVGLACLAIAALNDSLVGAGVLSMPYMLSLGFTLSVLATGGVKLGRFFAQTRALESLSRELESQVQRRTDELADAQAALLNAEKLAALGRVAAGAAHELNNPCAVVNTNLAYLHHTLIEKQLVPDDAERCLTESIGATSRIAGIVRHLVDAGRAGGSARIEPSTFPVFEVAEKAVACARVGLNPCPNFKVVGDQSALARGDPTLLQQIIVNLAINAAHAVESRNGDGRVRLNIYDDNRYVVIDVVDNGEGIAQVQHVFEPFFTTKRPGHGMGLGLAVSLGLARAQGGDIVVASTNPSGTTMRLRLAKPDPLSAAAERVEKFPGLLPRSSRLWYVPDRGRSRTSRR